MKTLLRTQVERMQLITTEIQQIKPLIINKVKKMLKNTQQVSVENYHSTSFQPDDTTAYTLSNGLSYVKFLFDCKLLDIYAQLTNEFQPVIMKLNDSELILRGDPIPVVRGDKLSFHLYEKMTTSMDKQNFPIFVQIIYKHKLNFYDSTVQDVD